MKSAQEQNARDLHHQHQLSYPFKQSPASSHPGAKYEEIDNLSPILLESHRQLRPSDPLTNSEKESTFKLSLPAKVGQNPLSQEQPRLLQKLKPGANNSEKVQNLLFHRKQGEPLVETIYEDQEILTAKKESLGPLQQKCHKRSESGTTTEFDMIAKEISSSRRAQDVPRQESPCEGGAAAKWAVLKDSQQETQKKGSSQNPAEIVSRTLKSHDSSNYNFTSGSSNQHQQIRGKVLDFGNSESSQKQQQFGGVTTLEKKFMLGTDESQQYKNIPSFLHEEGVLDMRQKRKEVQGLKFVEKQLCLALKLAIDDRKDCQLCSEHKVYHSSIDCSKIEDPKTLPEVIQENLNRKYLTSREYYNVKIINDIIYNENTHIVSVFKDYLIFDDVSEFLKRFYNKLESLQRLPRMFEFYEKYSKIFANYVILPENKYMFKNIERKQRLQDEKQRILHEQQQRANGEEMNHSADKHRSRHRDRFSSHHQHQNSSSISHLSNNRMFDTKFIDSVANIQPSGVIERSLTQSNLNQSLFQEHNSSAMQIQKQLQQNMQKAKEKKNKKKGGLCDMSLGDLISKFIQKDTESQISSSLLQTQSKDAAQAKITKIAVEGAPKTKAHVYEYKEKVIANPTSAVNTENSRVSSKVASGAKEGSKVSGKRLSTAEDKEEGKVLNYNIYNNFNQYINNENYYISTDKDAVVSDSDQQQQQSDKEGVRTQRSLNRNPSRTALTAQASSVATNPTGQRKLETPMKQEGGLEQKSPQGGSVGRKEHLSKERKTKEDPQKKKWQVEVLRQNECISINANQQTQRYSNDPQVSPRGILKSHPPPIPNPIALTTRELSQEKQKISRLPNKGTYISPVNPLCSEALNRVPLQPNPAIRSIERQRLDEGSEQSKYLNEYGLVVAKAVNQIRQKSGLQRIEEAQKHASLEKKRSNSRGLSSSQTRKNSNHKRQGNAEMEGQAAKNEKSQHKVLRSVRTKQIHSNNSSNQHTIQKMSPEKAQVLQNQIKRTGKPTIKIVGGNMPGCKLTERGEDQGLKKLVLQWRSRKEGDEQHHFEQYLDSGLDVEKHIATLKASKRDTPQHQNISQTQTPKRMKIQKTKSTSNLNINKLAYNHLHNKNDCRGRFSDIGLTDQQYPTGHLTSSQKDMLTQISSLGLNPLQLNQLNELQLSYAHSLAHPVHSALGTYAPTSILGSPLSFKHVATQRHNQKPNARTSSRNGNSSQQQSKRSNSSHLRAPSGPSKPKKDRGGSKNSKKQAPPAPQQSSILQALQYQQHNFEQEPNSQILGLSQSIKLRPSQIGSSSMKNLKAMHQPLSQSKEAQPPKVSRPKQGQNIYQYQQKQTSTILQSHRQQNYQPSLITQIIKSKHKNSKPRADSKKRSTPQNMGGPFQFGYDTSSRMIDSTTMGGAVDKMLSYSRSQENLEGIVARKGGATTQRASLAGQTAKGLTKYFQK